MLFGVLGGLFVFGLSTVYRTQSSRGILYLIILVTNFRALMVLAVGRFQLGAVMSQNLDELNQIQSLQYKLWILV